MPRILLVFPSSSRSQYSKIGSETIGTFPQVSSNHPDEREVRSVDEAHARCRAQGARLWEPRTTSGVFMLNETDLKPGHFEWLGAGAQTMVGLTIEVRIEKNVLQPARRLLDLFKQRLKIL